MLGKDGVLGCEVEGVYKKKMVKRWRHKLKKKKKKEKKRSNKKNIGRRE